MRQPSLYVYFDSKNALYDAMFADGNRQLLERLDALELPHDPRAAVKALHADVRRLRGRGRGALRVALPPTDPRVRAVGRSRTSSREQMLDRASELLRAAGLESPDDVDCFVAMVAGLIERADQQRPRRRPLDPPSRPTHRHVPRRRATKETPPMIPDRIARPEAKVLAEEEFRRFAVSMGVAHRRRVDAADRLRRRGTSARWRCTCSAAADAQASVPAVPAPVPAGHPAQQGDRLAPLGRRHQRAADPRALAPLPTTRSWRSSRRWARRRSRAGGGRRRPMRYLPIPFGPPIGWKPLKYLLDVGLHARRVGAPHRPLPPRPAATMQLTPEHDGRLVADIVAEWASIHGEPFELVLDGPGRREVQPGRRRRARRDRRDRVHPRALRAPAGDAACSATRSRSDPSSRRTGDHDLARRGDEDVVPLHDAAGIVGVGQDVERSEVVVVELLAKLVAGAAKVSEHHSTWVVRERRVEVLAGDS